MDELKLEAEVLHKSLVHFWRKSAVHIHQGHNVPCSEIEAVGWAAQKVMQKNYNKEMPSKYLVGAAGCA